MRLYKEVEKIERPIEIQLKINLDLGQIEHCLNLERNLLKQKVDKKEFIYWKEKEARENKTNMDEEEKDFAGSMKGSHIDMISKKSSLAQFNDIKSMRATTGIGQNKFNTGGTSLKF